MIWIEHSPKAGRERAGSHPFLVLSPRAFNEKTGLLIGCAMTGKQAHNPFAVANPRDPARASYILADQPRSFDWRKRRARKRANAGTRSRSRTRSIQRLTVDSGSIGEA